METPYTDIEVLPISPNVEAAPHLYQDVIEIYGFADTGVKRFPMFAFGKHFAPRSPRENRHRPLAFDPRANGALTRGIET